MSKKDEISITPKLTNQSEIVLYQPNDSIRLEVRIEEETVWLDRNQLSILFGRDVKTIGKHISNALHEELRGMATVAKFAIVQNEGGRLVNRHKEFYNLDMVLSVGYRVKSEQGILFRRWANSVLKEYMLKGYAVNQRLERLEQRVSKTEEQIGFFVRTSLPPTQGIFFDGQIFDAYTFVCDLVRQAKTRIVLIDNYVNDSDETVYHLGASMKDLGKKWFAFSRMECNGTIGEDVATRLSTTTMLWEINSSCKQQIRKSMSQPCLLASIWSAHKPPKARSIRQKLSISNPSSFA